MFRKVLLIPFAILLSIPACSPTGETGTSQAINQNQNFADALINNPKKDFNNTGISLNKKYVKSVQSFSNDFYKTIQDKTNQIYSPVSITTCFSMLYEGARTSSQEELKGMLHYDESFNHQKSIQDMLLKCAINDKEHDAFLDLAQSFWVDDSFAEDVNKDYLKVLEEYYYAEAFQGRLASDAMHQLLADYINAKTNNFLDVKKEDFKDLEGVLWLLNTIYSKAPWVEEFDVAMNRNMTFNNIDKTTKQMTFMSKVVEEGYYIEGENYLVSSLPLLHDLSFNMLLPNEGEDYAKVLSSEEALNAMYNVSNGIGCEQCKIHYIIPKFENKAKYDLNELLPKMGVSKIFTPGLADLTGIGGGLYVAKSLHEAGIKVDNAGTEAAAYTIIVVDKAGPSEPEKIISFVCDRPFAYSITTSEGLPLFVGSNFKF